MDGPVDVCLSVWRPEVSSTLSLCSVNVDAILPRQVTCNFPLIPYLCPIPVSLFFCTRVNLSNTSLVSRFFHRTRP